MKIVHLGIDRFFLLSIISKMLEKLIHALICDNLAEHAPVYIPIIIGCSLLPPYRIANYSGYTVANYSGY